MPCHWTPWILSHQTEFMFNARVNKNQEILSVLEGKTKALWIRPGDGGSWRCKPLIFAQKQHGSSECTRLRCSNKQPAVPEALTKTTHITSFTYHVSHVGWRALLIAIFQGPGWQRLHLYPCLPNHPGEKAKWGIWSVPYWLLKPPHGRNIWHFESHFTRLSKSQRRKKYNPSVCLEGQGKQNIP